MKHFKFLKYRNSLIHFQYIKTYSHEIKNKHDCRMGHYKGLRLMYRFFMTKNTKIGLKIRYFDGNLKCNLV